LKKTRPANRLRRHVPAGAVGARQKRVPQAADLLGRLITNFGTRRPTETSPAESSGWRNFLAKRRAANTLGIEVAATVQDARKLADLLATTA